VSGGAPRAKRPLVIPLRDNLPTRTFPVVTVAFVCANVVVWLAYQVPQLEQSIIELGFLPCEAQQRCLDPGVPYPLDVVTAMFAHAGWLHVIGNLLFLWIFGDNVEDAMGRVRFAMFYLLAGTLATALQASVTLAFGSRGEAAMPNIGASGAISGVLGAYFVLFPWARVLGLVPLLIVLIPVEMPAILFLGLWFVFQLWQGGFSLLAPDGEGGVAFFAHVGGFIFGLLAVHAFAVYWRPWIAGRW
jgi:membrane associated rhomboid family serine protease